MCGIAGWISHTTPIDEKLFSQMRDTLTHRGPDAAGNYFSSNRKAALGHRRLSFLDLTESGKQPMCNEDGTVWIVLNGEIYNYLELKKELLSKDHIFKSSSDTEVLIHGYEEWGIEGLLDKIKGMFAFGLLDEKQQFLFLARDRFGIKPLYYHASKDCLIFGSELKAIINSKATSREINYSAFSDYFVYRYVPSPKTIWKDISKLPPAHLLKLNISSGNLSIIEYWELNFKNNFYDPIILANEVEDIFIKSMSEHSRSDVEIGSFLSGGYDSSAIAYYLTQIKTQIKTFSIGFENWDKSEHKFAEIVAAQLNTLHTSIIADSQSLNVLNKLSRVYDEPIADISIIPTYLVSQEASRHVKAVMSGEGSDELFGGYDWQKKHFIKWHPHGIFDSIKNIFHSHSRNTVSEYSEYMAMGRFNRTNLLELINPDLHRHIEHDSEWFYRNNFNPKLTPLKSIQLLDIKCFMSELVLTKVDRASMANSLEVRVPFLDHELFEKVFQFNEAVYFKPNTTKFLLYENIKNKLPQEILQRKKQGFVGPDSYYMKMDWYQEIILNSKLIGEKIINQKFTDELFNKKDHWRLWKLAVMANWWDEWTN